MFLITSRDLAPRMGYLPPLRNLRIVQHGNLEAPVGTVGQGMRAGGAEPMLSTEQMLGLTPVHVPLLARPNWGLAASPAEPSAAARLPARSPTPHRPTAIRCTPALLSPKDPLCRALGVPASICTPRHAPPAVSLCPTMQLIVPNPRPQVAICFMAVETSPPAIILNSTHSVSPCPRPQVAICFMTLCNSIHLL